VSDDLLNELLGSTSAFEHALTSLPVLRGTFVARLLERLDSSELGNAERERRLSAVFLRANLNAVDYGEIVETGLRVENGVLRNALTGLLPAEYKPKIYRGIRQPVGLPVQSERTSAVSPAAAIVAEISREDASLEPSDPHSDVLLLSSVDEQATRKLLASRGFVPLRCTSMDQLDAMLATNPNVCALLVSSSFLVSLDRVQQVELIKALARFSTFCWLRFEEEKLILSNLEVTELVQSERCRTTPPESTSIEFRTGPLQERELDYLQAARAGLNIGTSRSLFTPGELKHQELLLLGAAMAFYSRSRQFGTKTELSAVTTTFLQGGQTGAKVALVKVNDFRIPIIVKLYEKEFLVDEARRFLTFIYRDNKDLNPELHLHGSAALIVFDIISGHASGDAVPAPTLEHELTSFWYSEMNSPSTCGDGGRLVTGLASTLQRLVALNSQKCVVQGYDGKANPYLESIKKMESEGFSWGFSPAQVAKRNTAEELILSAPRAVCHGDAHARNVLIRGDQGYLIDYAYSGPGHPCVDLVRLELSLFLNHFRAFGTDADLIQMQRAFSRDRLDFDQLCRGFPQLASSASNRLCLRMCVDCRDRIAEILKVHKLDWSHYLAVKLASAWQALQVPSLQQSTTRAVIIGLCL
jgi:hypothetical protein